MPYPPAGTEIVIVPSLPPKHDTAVLATVAERTGGWVIARAGLSMITHAVLAASLIRTL